MVEPATFAMIQLQCDKHANKHKLKSIVLYAMEIFGKCDSVLLYREANAGLAVKNIDTDLPGKIHCRTDPGIKRYRLNLVVMGLFLFGQANGMNR
ncbi:MAG: hypothetical protein RRB22_14910 [Gammaproteobacteria bacterium]|nr:hypothetical protein [Gammaproteobacteria bacterium]